MIRFRIKAVTYILTFLFIREGRRLLRHIVFHAALQWKGESLTGNTLVGMPGLGRMSSVASKPRKFCGRKGGDVLQYNRFLVNDPVFKRNI